LATGKPKSGSAGVSLTSAVFSFIFTIFSLALIQLFPVGSATFEKAIIVLIVVQVVGPLAAFILNQFGRAESASQRLAGASLSILTVGVTIANGIQTWYPALYSLFETYLPSALEISNYTSFPPTLPSQVALLKAGTQIVADAKASPVLLFLVADAILVFFSFTVFAAVELGLFDAIRGVFYAIFFSPAAATAFWLSKRQAKFYEAELDLAKKVATGKKN
jgi:type IV secretory pathway TrbD component